MSSWFRNLTVAQKLYAVIGVVAVLLVTELIVLRYSIYTLSALRSFAQIESSWFGAQKNASLNLYQYAVTGDVGYYLDYEQSLRVPEGYRKGREALEACRDLNACPELMRKAREGYILAGIPPEEADGLIRVMRHFRRFSGARGAGNMQRRADAVMEEFTAIGTQIHLLMQDPNRSSSEVRALLRQVDRLNEEFAEIRRTFTRRMGETAALLEKAMVWLLVIVVLSFGSVIFLIVYRLISSFRVRIQEVKDVAQQVAKGDLSARIQVGSQDEMGAMADGLNHMIEELEVSHGRQAQAESASRLKNLFLANMSHEVRTPLGVILGMIDVLKTGQMGEEDRLRYLQVIERTGKSLQAIIDDILDISKIEAGHLEINKAVFELSDFTEELNQNLQLLAERSRNQLVFQIPSSLPRRIFSDRVRLRQILTNLVSNGLKFTHEGQVTIQGLIEDGRLVFLVRDTGIGIPHQERDRLFKPFSQVDHGSNRKYGGTGLGLLLSKKLAQAMGGDLVLLETQPGLGSTFKVTLGRDAMMESYLESPTLRLSGKEDWMINKAEEVDQTLKGKRVLLVEDSLDNQMLVQLFLRRKGMSIDCANNGQEGIEKASLKPYDLILMDMQMPVVDGYAATEELRRRGIHAPIVALTAHAMKEDREHCLEVGCNDYLTKPIDPPLFYRTLARQFEAAAGDAAPS